MTDIDIDHADPRHVALAGQVPVLYTGTRPILDRLPDWLDGSTLTAITDGYQRVLLWTFSEPGRLFRNEYRLLWIKLREQAPLTYASPLWLGAERALPGESWQRDSCTSTARERMSAGILPCFAEHAGSFDTLWVACHQCGISTQPAEQGLAEAQRVVRWWEQKEWLDSRWQGDLLTLAPLKWDDDVNQYARRLSVRVAPGFRYGNYPQADVMGRVMMPAYDLADSLAAENPTEGTQVGWFTKSGDLIPLAAILDGETR